MLLSQVAPIFDTEGRRIEAVRTSNILDTAREETFDRFSRLAKGIFDAPVGTVSIIDSDRQFLKSAVGCERGSMPRGQSVCTWTIAQDDPLVVPDLGADARFAQLPVVAGPPHFRFYAGAPLKNRDGYNLGAVCCLDFRPRTASPEQLQMLQDLAQVVVEAMDWRLVATTDSLTGAMTRRAFLEAAHRDIALAQRHQRPLTWLMLDVDHFKSVNDSYGHAAGDQVLRGLAALCRHELRASDYFGRIGGEEFAMILRDTTAPQGFEVAERLREKIAGTRFGSGSRAWRVTASMGVAGLQSRTDADALFAAADAALYAAKRMGRNRTVMEHLEAGQSAPALMARLRAAF